MTPLRFSHSAAAVVLLCLGVLLCPARLSAGVTVVHDVPFLEAGRKETLDLYLPERAARDPGSPAIVWIHGGGWVGGSKSEARAASICGTLAAAGYVCVSVEYRLGPGSWPTNLLDCKNAIRFLRAKASEYHVDPDRVGVMGGSAGGHLALMVGLTSGVAELEPKAPYPGISDAVCAIGDFYGNTDLLTRLKPSPKGKLNGQLSDGVGEAKVFGATRTENPGLWRLGSPVTHVRADSPPVFIAHGLADPTVDYEQSKELDRVLAEHGVPHEIVLLPGIGHTFDLTSWNKKPLPQDLRPVVLAFLRRYVGIPGHGLPVIPAAPSPRVETNLDLGWKFLPRDEPRASEAGWDDSSWESIDVPHTWNGKDGQDGGNDYRRGPSWYRRHVAVDAALSGRRLYLQFDGVSLVATVYVNGIKIGTHQGGFARFCMDATSALKPGGDNVVAVRADNGSLGIAPMSADFTFFGGIYRSVRLLSTGQVQISTSDFGSSGVYLDQSGVSSEEARVLVRTLVERHESPTGEIEVRATIVDAEGKEVGSGGTTVQVAAGGAAEARVALSVTHPHLWDGKADPYLYSVRVDLLQDGRVADSVTQPLGLRFFRVDPDKGFILNGHPLDLHGVSRHQDRPGKGWAINPADEAEDFEFVRELGCTAVRGAHYPHADTWYQRFDRAGIVAWAEIPFVNEALPTPEFLENAKVQLRELIRQNYNHPSICFWGVGNETRDTEKGAIADRVIVALASLVHEEDPSRLSTYASNAKEGDPRNWRTDVVDFNHYSGWYSASADDWPEWLDSIHKAHPKSAFGISEYGAGANITQHADNPAKPVPTGPFHPEEYQSIVHEKAWLAMQSRPYLWSKFVWNLFDFASDRRNEGEQPGINDKGLVTYDRRVRKDAYGWYKAQWNPEPEVWLASRRFVRRTAQPTEVKVYSNAGEVELWVNGVSLGKRTSADHRFVWAGVQLRDGQNAVTARGSFGNQTLSDGCTWVLGP